MENLLQIDKILGLVVSIGVSMGVIYGWVVRPIRKLLKNVQTLTEDVAFLQGDRLNHAHDYYMQRGWCPGAKKRELERWYIAYKRAGHNHLADNYITDLMGLPEKPNN